MYLEKFFNNQDEKQGCIHCNGLTAIEFNLKMAFQPIVNVQTSSIFAYEALVRGNKGESAHEVISKVTPEQLYRFDQTCRVLAIQTAARLGMQAKLCINFLPNAIYEPASCIKVTLAAAKQCDFPIEDIILEVSESEKVISIDKMKKIVEQYKKMGFGTAIDDFGAGYAGLGLLANFQPNIIKLDMGLIRNINTDKAKFAIVDGVVRTCHLLNILVIAEGVETMAEYEALTKIGIHLFQGYLFAKPQTEALPLVDFDAFTLNFLEK